MKKSLIALAVISAFASTVAQAEMSTKDWVYDGIIVGVATAVGSPAMGVAAAGVLAYNEGAFESFGLEADKPFTQKIKMENDMPNGYANVAGFVLDFSKTCESKGGKAYHYNFVYDEKGWKQAIAQGNHHALSQNGVRDANGIIRNGDLSKPDFTDELQNRVNAGVMLHGSTHMGIACRKTAIDGGGHAMEYSTAWMEQFVDKESGKFIINQKGFYTTEHLELSVNEAILQGDFFIKKYQSKNF